MLHDALAVDDEEAAQGDAVRGQHAEGLGDLLLEVGDERVGEVAFDFVFFVFSERKTLTRRE